MTYLFKLVRRLAISRGPALLTVLVSLAACDGDSTAPESQGPSPDANPISLEVHPRSVTIETSQRVQFRGLTRSMRGEPVETPLVWRASGGAIKPDGSFLSATAGTFQIFARGRGWRHTDTAVVRVVLPQPQLARITIAPRATSVEPGGTRAFTVKAFLLNGSGTPLGVNWSATGGTIDPSGVYTADSLPGAYFVIASNTGGTIADTVGVIVGSPLPTPTPTPSPAPTGPGNLPTAPGHMRVFIRPARVSLIAGGKQQYQTFGRTRAGDSVSVDVTYRVTGGTITAGGLFTAGPKAGTYRVIANLKGLSDTALVTLSNTPAPVPLPTPTPAPPPSYTGKMGVPIGVSGLLSSGASPQAYTMSLDGYSADNIVRRLADARSRNLHVFMNLTGGAHENYKTGGKFDLAKWQAKMNTYNTPAIKQAVGAAVADGIIVGSSVMDEPQQVGTDSKAWGPAGWITKAKVDDLCGRVKAIFPTLAVGVNHDYRVFEPNNTYATCDFVVSQYRLSKGPIAQYRDNGVAFARRSNIAIGFGINILHGGTPGSSCQRYGDEATGTSLCPMTPAQIREFGTALGTAGCILNMWRYEPGYFNQPEVQAAVRDLGATLGKLPRKGCVRS